MTEMRECNITIGGEGVVCLTTPINNSNKPKFTRAQILPGRGFMVLQIGAYIPGIGEINVLEAPQVPEAARVLDAGGADDYGGIKSFRFGAAVLIPYANRIRGTQSGSVVSTKILDKQVHLPAFWGGKPTRFNRYAMHGLILASPVQDVEIVGAGRVRGRYLARDFGVGWPSETDLTFDYKLDSDAFHLSVTAANIGDESLPIGIGWHPYFALPSGNRSQARLRLPSIQRLRVENEDYSDEVLPLGEALSVSGTSYDFSAEGGRELGQLFLDDCYIEPQKTAEGYTVAEVRDPASSYGLRVIATSPHVRAMQVYAPPEKAFIVYEPQFNLADPFWDKWPSEIDTGMVILQPKESVTYSVCLQLFIP